MVVALGADEMPAGHRFLTITLTRNESRGRFRREERGSSSDDRLPVPALRQGRSTPCLPFCFSRRRYVAVDAQNHFV